MADPSSRRSILDSLTGGLPIPAAAKAGGFVIAIGLVVDLVAHTVGYSAHAQLIGAFPLGEHFAHLIVLVGMVIVLAGIVADGVRTHRRLARQEGRTRDAVR